MTGGSFLSFELASCSVKTLTFDTSGGQRRRSGLWDVRSMEGLGGSRLEVLTACRLFV
jgi:hypothetical protein